MGIVTKHKSQRLRAGEHFIDRAVAEHRARPLRALAVGPDRVRRRGDHGGDLPRALPGQLRQQDDVEPDHRHPAGDGGRDRRACSAEWAKTALPITAPIYTANGLLGEYYHARGVARRPGRFPAGHLQPADGAADHGAGADDDRRRDGPAGRAAATGGLTMADRDLPKPDHLPQPARATASPASRAGCRASVGARPRR